MKISVITPSYNQGPFILRTIQSVLTQDCGMHELQYVVMDGGSNDQTVSILQSHGSALEWMSEPDGGQANAVNKGIRATSSDIIGWLNSDDVYYPEAIKTICDYFTQHPDVDVIYGDALLIDVDDNRLDDYPTERWHLERFKSRCFISQPATFFRRDVVKQYGFLDETLNYCLDYEYWLRLGLNGANIVYLPTILAGARIYADTKSSRCCTEASLEAITMLQKKLGYIPPDWVINHSIATIKKQYGLDHLQACYLPFVALDLWKVAGLHQRGLARARVFVSSLGRLTRKVLVRGINRTRRQLKQLIATS